MNIALLASGKGSNVKNILSHFQEIDDININLVATNNPIAQLFNMLMTLM